MNRLENGTFSTNGLPRDTQKFFDTLRPMGKKCLKLILTHLYFIKYNAINIGNSDVQKHISYKNYVKSTNIMCASSHKNFLIHCILRGKLFKAYFNIFIFSINKETGA